MRSKCKGAVLLSSLLFIACASCVEAGSLKERIKHIVVLMMENRSFDHLLGYLKSDHNSKIDGLSGNEQLPRDIDDLSKGYVSVSRGGYDVSPDDPKHGFDDIALQINQDKMDGFVYDSLKSNLNETNPVSMFDKSTAPIINTLATEFALFDRWFASAPTSTDPNRAFALSGTSEGVISNFNGTLWPQMSYFEYLRSHNKSFRGYYQDDVWVFGYFQDMQKPEVSAHIHELEPYFYKDVAAGDLADFTWLQPRSSVRGVDRPPTWQHPDASVLEGEKLIKQVYEALRAGPKWEETLFLITYDEHGGFYDHVAPPRGVPAPDDHIAPNGFAFDQLGVRIPTLAISPWVPKGFVVHEALSSRESPTPSSQFDATSLLATSNKLLGLRGAEPLGKRMAWSNTFAELFDILPASRGDCPLTLPSLSSPPLSPLAFYELQRSKPLNEHLEGMLLFFCSQHYAAEHSFGKCPGRPSFLSTQGLASDWLARETAVYKRDKLLGAAREMGNQQQK